MRKLGHPGAVMGLFALALEDELVLPARAHRNLVNRSAEGAGENEKNRMRRHFRLSIRYEYMFWDMAYGMEGWSNS